MGEQMRGADLLVESLVDAGVELLFGVPGDTGVVLYDALHARTDRIRHVLARDERHAATMADAYARLSNRVGVVEVSSGGGACFAVGGLGEAYAAAVPVLLVTSDIHAASRGTGALTEIDQETLFTAVTKWRTVVASAAELPAAVAEALRQATSGRPGPVAVICPENVLDERVDPAELGPAVVRLGADRVPSVRAAADPDQVARAAVLLARAARPAFVVGSGVHLSQAWDALALLAERAAVPVATTIHGKGSVPDSSPWSLGVVGNNGAWDHANAYVADADLVVLLGTRANATDTNSWTGPARAGTDVVHVDVDAVRCGANYPDALRLVGDARTVLEQLAAETPYAAPEARESRLRWVREHREAWEKQTPRVSAGPGQVAAADVVRCAHDVLGGDVVVLADPGTPTPHVACFWETGTAGRSVLVPRGHGPMGWAIPAAVGAALARPGEPVVAVTADGSFAMACGELETVARFGLPVLYLQLTNHSLGWIKMLQHLYTEGRYFDVDPGPIDAVAVARACGLEAARARDLGELRGLVRSFAEAPRPLYVDVEVPHLIDDVPPVPAWHAALSGDTERPVY